MPIEYASDEDLKYYVNDAIAKAIGITIPAEILEKATIYE